MYTVGSGAVLASRPVSWAKSVATLSSHYGNVVIDGLLRKWGVCLTGQSMKFIFVILDDISFDNCKNSSSLW